MEPLKNISQIEHSRHRSPINFLVSTQVRTGLTNTNRWQRIRQVTQVLSAALFFLLALLTFRGSDSLIPLDLYFRLDPFAAFTAMLASRAIITTMLLAAAAVVFGFIFGRAFCGWLCPLGAILDWVSPRKAGRIEPRASWRGIKYILLIVGFFAALLGNLSLLILDPITIVNRTFTSAVMPVFTVILVTVETALYSIAPPLEPLLDGIGQHYRGTVLSAQQTFYQFGWMLALFFVTIVGLNWVASRFWCRYLCPLGAIYALQAKISWLRPRAVQDCSHCAACMRVCPTSAITVKKNGVLIDPAECVVCMDCVAVCSETIIDINFGGRPESSLASFDLGRRHLLQSAAFAVAGVVLFHTAPSARRDDPFLVRPPGVHENGFLDKCIRCAECIKVCPTGALQPSLFEFGFEGIWSPLLVSRIGYCDYSCNACGQICPTGAIPPLSLEEKREEIIGVAYIDQNRCIPWALFRNCVVCEEVCPLPKKAVRLEKVTVVKPDGKLAILQRPHVNHDLCIGCGICEYQCPQAGPAAIRVYVPTKLPAFQTSR